MQDLVQAVEFEHRQLDDWILVRTDGTPTYNFCVVVDDVDMRISHVIRGNDHLSNTPKQVLCYEALGYPVPAFAHVSMILGPDRGRLSKRHGATSVQAYASRGSCERWQYLVASVSTATGDLHARGADRRFDTKDVSAPAPSSDQAKLEGCRRIHKTATGRGGALSAVHGRAG